MSAQLPPTSPSATALHKACADLGTILFTLSLLDPARGVVWRSYTSHPAEYPLQGTKPLDHDAWYESCVVGQKPFVANTPAEFETHFFDHALITSMGLGSAMNIPLADAHGEVRITVNLLAESGHFTKDRQAAYLDLAQTHRAGLLSELA